MNMCSCFKPKLVLHNKAIKGRLEHGDDSVSIGMRDITVRIVHPGGRIEMYHDAIPVSILTQRYPGMCIARPTIFKRPHESLLSAGDALMPGNKYFVIHNTAVEKLKRRLKQESDESAKSLDVGDDHFKETVCPASRDSDVSKERRLKQEPDESAKNECVGDDHSKEIVCPATRDYFLSKESWTTLQKKVKHKRQFMPPIQKPKLWKETDWEPSLTSIQEVSP